MKILVTGASGQLGKSVLYKKPSNFDILYPSRKELDLSNIENLKKYLRKHKPSFVINCAAFTNVEKAELSKELAYLINAKAPKIIAEELKNYGGNLLQISTDYVFDGKSNSPYKVDNKRNPISAYGYSKAKGEEFVEKILHKKSQLIILRVSWLVGPQGKNFISTILNLHSKNNPFSVVYDQIGVISSTLDVAEICWEIISKWSLISKKTHILHWSCQGISSWYDIAMAIGDIALELDILNKKSQIMPIKSEEYNSLVNRPKYSILDCNYTKEIIKSSSKYWRHELKNILMEIKKNYPSQIKTRN